MVDARCGKEPAFPSRLGCAGREVDFLEIHEEPLVEAIERLEERPPDHEERPDHLVHLPRLAALPGREQVGWKDRGRDRERPVASPTITPSEGNRAAAVDGRPPSSSRRMPQIPTSARSGASRKAIVRARASRPRAACRG